MDYGTLKPSATFQLRPSLGSAFQPLSRTPGPEEGLDEAAGGNEPELEKEWVARQNNQVDQITHLAAQVVFIYPECIFPQQWFYGYMH